MNGMRSSATRASLVNARASKPRRKKNVNPSPHMNSTACATERAPTRRACSESPAPNACPTNVDAAAEKPSPGTQENDRSRTPMAYAAMAAVP